MLSAKFVCCPGFVFQVMVVKVILVWFSRLVCSFTSLVLKVGLLVYSKLSWWLSGFVSVTGFISLHCRFWLLNKMVCKEKLVQRKVLLVVWRGVVR